MALLNKKYIFVIDENIDRSIEISEHPVEKGLNITDNVKKQPYTISLKGEIVGKNAKNTRNKIISWHEKGKLVTYIGINKASKCIISSFKTGHPNTIQGGCSFEMELRKIRIAKSPYKKKKKKASKSQVIEKKKHLSSFYTVRKGDTLYKIAELYYGKGTRFRDIYNANKKTMKDPKDLHIGQKIKIPD